MNNCSLMGRLTKDVDLRYTTNQVPVAGFTLAVNRDFKQEGQPEADFIPVVAWNKTAEFCNKYFSKGQQIGVIGRIQTRSWDDNDGNKHYVTEIVAEKVYFAGDKKEKQENQPPQNTPPAEQNPNQSQNQGTPGTLNNQNQQQGKNNPPWMR